MSIKLFGDAKLITTYRTQASDNNAQGSNDKEQSRWVLRCNRPFGIVRRASYVATRVLLERKAEDSKKISVVPKTRVIRAITLRP